MHAILALAGSHLALQVDNPKVHLALSHRQKAITGLQDAFTRWPPSADDAHVMLATAYLLSFQSSYTEDGLLECILSLRGCALLSQLICRSDLKGPFVVRANMDSITMEQAFREFPRLDQGLAYEALQSMANFSHLVSRPTTHAIEKALLAQLVEIVVPLLEGDIVAGSSESNTPRELTDADTMAASEASYPSTQKKLHFMNPFFPTNLPHSLDHIDWDEITKAPSHTRNPVQSFNALMSTLLILSTWPYDAIMHLMSPTNQLGNLIMAHFCAIRIIVSPLSAPKNALLTPIRTIVQWTAKIIAAVQDEEEVQWTRYVEWPKKILRCLDACLEKKHRFLFEDLRDMVINEPEAYKEGRARRF